MAVAVACQLVALTDNSADHMRIALRDPAKGEERGLRIAARQHVEDAVDISLDATLKRIPLRASNMRRKCRDLKIVFDVDRQGISD